MPRYEYECDVCHCLEHDVRNMTDEERLRVDPCKKDGCAGKLRFVEIPATQNIRSDSIWKTRLIMDDGSRPLIQGHNYKGFK